MSSETFLRCRRRDGKAMAAFLPWVVEEAALAATGERLRAKFLREGDLLISARSQAEAAALMTVTSIAGVAVDMTRPLHLNRSQGSICTVKNVCKYSCNCPHKKKVK